MGSESQLELHFPNVFKNDLGPYMQATGAAGIGEFLVMAINFDLGCSGSSEISLSECLIENQSSVIKDRDNNRYLTHIVKMKFRGNAGEVISDLMPPKGTQREQTWLMQLVQNYADFLDGRPSLPSQREGSRFNSPLPTRSARPN